MTAAKKAAGRVYCTKHGKPLYLQIEGAAVCVKGCYIDLQPKAIPEITEPRMVHRILGRVMS